MFEDVPHAGVELPDVGFDIGSYVEVSRRVTPDYLLFLNSHSEIAAPGWLALLAQYGTREGVGIAGAMGSYESIRDTVLLLRNVVWKSIGLGSDYDERLAYYFDFVLRQHHPHWYLPSGEVAPPISRNPRWLKKAIMAAARIVRYPWFRAKGTAVIWRSAPPFDFTRFPPFPNPHVRSNGFVVRRELFVDLCGSQMSTKMDANLFESGPDSLTAKLRRSGLAALVAGRDGNAYAVPDWPQSRTFRLGDQANLLFTDNHTRAFDSMSDGARAVHAWMTWGDSVSIDRDLKGLLGPNLAPN